jgi:class 3 adenylate cyclase
VNTPIKRKLAAILSADVAGYSRLMEADEEGTLRLLAAHRLIIDSIIDLHDGRVVNTAGDSVLAEFTSPVEAVRAANEIQDALGTRNESLPERRRMLFRIGVHLGDVMIQGDDLLGDGVNVAARLQAMAEPGGICISASIFDQIEGKLSLRFQDIGEQTVKNIARPVRAFVLSGSASAAVPRPAPASPRRRRGMMIALTVAGLIVLAGGAYLGGLVPDLGRQGRQEAAAWEAVKGTSDFAALESYLAAYPASVHAGEARARIADLLTRARQAVEAERARAEVDLARLKAGEAEAARAKAEADAVRVKAEAGRAKTEAEASRPAAVPSPPSQRESRFDGVWVGELTCPGWRGGPGFQRPRRAVVQNGEVTLELTPVGRRSIRAIGKVHDDDTVELQGTGTTAGGRVVDHIVKGRFVGDSFTGQVEAPARPCSFQLSRESTNPRSGR